MTPPSGAGREPSADPVQRTSAEWKRLLAPEVLILNYDGWDRTNLGEEWHEVLMTAAEFQERLMDSTLAPEDWPHPVPDEPLPPGRER